MARAPFRLTRIERALLLSGAAASLLAVAAFASEPPQRLEDVQVGERGAILRVALICRTRCDIEPGEGVEFRIRGVSAALDVDLASRSALARRLLIEPGEGESVVRIAAAGRINEARVIECQSDSGAAPCIEYRFAASSPDGAPLASAAPPKSPSIREDTQARISETGRDAPFIGAIILAPGPTLRDDPGPGIIYLPQFSPPERFTPPAIEKREDDQAAAAPVDVGRPSLIPVNRAETLSLGATVDIKREAATILDKSFDVGSCEGARARLMGDAWALDAMIDLAFCKAADGKLEEADSDFARLLAYTPDNYEALVGRGLIALADGNREKGLAFYQEALNALPPIAESDRIVEAMARN